MSKKNLDYIKSVVVRYSSLINAPATLQPTYGTSEDGARPHIEINVEGYHYVIVERGRELERITTSDIDELFFNIFDDITFQMASNFELDNRNNQQDFRRIMFKKQEELMGIINDNWRTAVEVEHKMILKEHPFSDN